MSQYTPQTTYREEKVSEIANPEPLGLLALALTTALIGGSFARFLMPTVLTGVGVIAVPALIYGGVIQVLAGMWAFRRNRSLDATLFSAYGGFLIVLGALFLPMFNLTTFFGADVLAFNRALGFLFLCWMISSVVLLLGALRTNMALVAVLALLCLCYLFLAIGEFANANGPLLAIGGWLGILCALVAWYAALGEFLRSMGSQFQLPMGEIGKTPRAPAHRYGSEPTT